MKKVKPTPKKAPNLRLSKKELLLAFGVLFIYLFYISSKDRIVNYPPYLTTFSLIVTFLAIIIIERKKPDALIHSIKNRFHIFDIALIFVARSILAWFISCILLIPFNYYNISVAKKNDLEYVDCLVKGGAKYSRDRRIFYEFNGELNSTFANKPIMEELRKSRNYDDYVFIAAIRKGLFGSYYLEDWDIKRR